MMNLSRSEAAAFLAQGDNYLILTHRRPDGDTLGSAAALCLGLRTLGKTAYILENPEITPKYAPLHLGLTCGCWEVGSVAVSVDVAAASMLPPEIAARAGEIALRIDHHGSGSAFAQRQLVEADSASCGEIVYELLCLLGISLDKAMAQALYTAVSTDTGCFRYANTTAHSFAVAAACMEAGGDIFSINQALFDTNSLARLRIQGWIAEHLKLYKDGKIAVCTLPRAVEQEIGVTEDDLENISGFPRSIEGVAMAATLRQTREGAVKVSIRAVPGFDASAVCARFGGGGHKGAAGATLELPLWEAEQAVAREMLSYFE